MMLPSYLLAVLVRSLRATRTPRVVLLLLCAVLLHPLVIHAQSASSTSIAGIITDASGAVIADAAVKLTDKATNIPRSINTNDQGRYFFADVVSGEYEIEVNKTGFRVTKTAVTAKVGIALTVDLKLELGAVTETVEVTTSNSELQTMNATVGNTLSGDALTNLPSINRDVYFRDLAARANRTDITRYFERILVSLNWRIQSRYGYPRCHSLRRVGS